MKCTYYLPNKIPNNTRLQRARSIGTARLARGTPVREASYTWDHRNRLTEAVERDSNGVIVRSVVYVYDIFDRRIAKIIDPDGSGPEEPREQRFVYDGDHILLEFEEGFSEKTFLQ